MVKRILLLFLVLSGPVSFGQYLADDAADLKRKRRDLWYADSSFTHSPPNTATTEENTTQKRTVSSGVLKKITGVLGYLMGGLILAALIYAFYLFSTKTRSTKPKTQKLREENAQTAEDLHETDFTSKIAAAESKGNYRQALRYYYLRLLRELSKQSLIRYEKDKTNKQYAEEIKNHKWGPDFRLATRYYNFVWYGEHPLDKESYQRLVTHFKKMLPHE
ncbi:MAG: DUF4129 domain-containing protein [Leadbetterella sp.]|nr:DUF4129 domain-containing protein [Leadbetterella sp.]